MSKNFFTQFVWISFEFSQVPCGEKNVGALRENPLFHISSYYCDNYYLTYLLIYIFLYIYKRKETAYALYL